MSRSDNTRPSWAQGADLTVEGYVSHGCTKDRGHKHRGPRSGSPATLECDFEIGNGHRNQLLCQSHRFVKVYTQLSSCSRVAYHPGGTRYIGGAAKIERKLRRRDIRSRERALLHNAKRMGLEAEFDLLPIREDNRTIMWDLS